MQKVIILMFMTTSLFAQEVKFGLEYPLLSYNNGYKLIASDEGEFFYGIGIGGMVQFRGITKNLIIKSSLSFSSYQNFETSKNSFFVVTLDALLDYLFLKNFYGGVGVGLHNFAVIPSTELKQTSIAGNFGAYFNQNFYMELKYNYLLSDNSMKNFNFLYFSFGYQF